MINKEDGGERGKNMGKLYDYFDGEWEEVDEEWLAGVELEGLEEVRFCLYPQIELEGLEEVRFAGIGKIECIYENGDRVYYQNIFGTWGFPTVIG